MDYSHSFLVPANAKKGSFIFNLFRPFDLVLFGGGIFVSFIFLMLSSSTDVVAVLVACLPAIITGLLVVPIPNYHNTLEAIKSIYYYYTRRRRYVWKGWCLYERFVSEGSKK